MYKYTENALAEKLGVSQQTINAWITDIRARQKTDRNSTIIRLSRLGWTQEKISNILGVSQSRVSEIIGNTSFGNIDNLLSQGRDMKYIAGHYHMNLALARPHPSPACCPHILTRENDFIHYLYRSGDILK